MPLHQEDLHHHFTAMMPGVKPSYRCTRLAVIPGSCSGCPANPRRWSAVMLFTAEIAEEPQGLRRKQQGARGTVAYIRPGGPGCVTDGVWRVLGREPIGFDQRLTENADAFHC